MLSVEVLEGARVIRRRSMGKSDRFLAGPSDEAELSTRSLPRMISLIRSKQGGAGWELLVPRGLEGHVSTDAGTRSIAELARGARMEGDLAVVPLPEGAQGSLELGDLVLRFREVDEGKAPPILTRPTADGTPGSSVGIAVVALVLLLLGLFLARSVQKRGDEPATTAANEGHTRSGAGNVAVTSPVHGEIPAATTRARATGTVRTPANGGTTGSQRGGSASDNARSTASGDTAGSQRAGSSSDTARSTASGDAAGSQRGGSSSDTARSTASGDTAGSQRAGSSSDTARSTASGDAAGSQRAGSSSDNARSTASGEAIGVARASASAMPVANAATPTPRGGSTATRSRDGWSSERAADVDPKKSDADWYAKHDAHAPRPLPTAAKIGSAANGAASPVPNETRVSMGNWTEGPQGTPPPAAKPTGEPGLPDGVEAVDVSRAPAGTHATPPTGSHATAPAGTRAAGPSGTRATAQGGSRETPPDLASGEHAPRHAGGSNSEPAKSTAHGDHTVTGRGGASTEVAREGSSGDSEGEGAAAAAAGGGAASETAKSGASGSGSAGSGPGGSSRNTARSGWSSERATSVDTAKADADWNATQHEAPPPRSTPVPVHTAIAAASPVPIDPPPSMGTWSDRPLPTPTVAGATGEPDLPAGVDPVHLGSRTATRNAAPGTPHPLPQFTPAPDSTGAPPAAAAGQGSRPKVTARGASHDAGGGAAADLPLTRDGGEATDKTTLAFLDATRASERTSKPGFEERLHRATSALEGAGDLASGDQAAAPRAAATLDGGFVGPDAGANRSTRTRDGSLVDRGSVAVGPASRDVRVASAGKVETPVEARGRSGDSGLVPNDDYRAILEVVKSAQGGLRRCYEDQLRRNPQLGGKVVLSWTVTEDGSAEDVAVESTTLRDADVESCLKTRVRRLRFAPPAGGAARIEFPFLFQAALEQG